VGYAALLAMGLQIALISSSSASEDLGWCRHAVHVLQISCRTFGEGSQACQSAKALHTTRCGTVVDEKLEYRERQGYQASHSNGDAHDERCESAIAALVRKEQAVARQVAREICGKGFGDSFDLHRLLAPRGPAAAPLGEEAGDKPATHQAFLHGYRAGSRSQSSRTVSAGELTRLAKHVASSIRSQPMLKESHGAEPTDDQVGNGTDSPFMKGVEHGINSLLKAIIGTSLRVSKDEPSRTKPCPVCPSPQATAQQDQTQKSQSKGPEETEEAYPDGNCGSADGAPAEAIRYEKEGVLPGTKLKIESFATKCPAWNEKICVPQSPPMLKIPGMIPSQNHGGGFVKDSLNPMGMRSVERTLRATIDAIKFLQGTLNKLCNSGDTVESFFAKVNGIFSKLGKTAAQREDSSLLGETLDAALSDTKWDLGMKHRRRLGILSGVEKGSKGAMEAAKKAVDAAKKQATSALKRVKNMGDMFKSLQSVFDRVKGLKVTYSNIRMKMQGFCRRVGWLGDLMYDKDARLNGYKGPGQYWKYEHGPGTYVQYFSANQCKARVVFRTFLCKDCKCRNPVTNKIQLVQGDVSVTLVASGSKGAIDYTNIKEGLSCGAWIVALDAMMNILLKAVTAAKTIEVFGPRDKERIPCSLACPSMILDPLAKEDSPMPKDKSHMLCRESQLKLIGGGTFSVGDAENVYQNGSVLSSRSAWKKHGEDDGKGDKKCPKCDSCDYTGTELDQPTD